MFGAPDHDAGVVDDLLQAPPQRASSARARSAPSGGRNHLHGFTATVVAFPG